MTLSPELPAKSTREYMVVARRYRPQLFGELVGQEHVARALSNAITAHRVGHAYLFTGARGVGKTSAARILAKSLDCIDGPTPTPCNRCDLCLSVSAGNDVDVLEIDGASNRGIDEIRQLRQNVGIRPSRARFKIYIIDEVHMLTKEAFNALLKTLEEPPEHVKFIFCTTEANKIPITILSRCQRFDFAGIRPNSIVARLEQIVAAEGVVAEPEALAILARRANGSMRDSQSLLEQILSLGQKQITAADVHSLLGTAGEQRLVELLQLLVAGDAAAALRELDQASAEGIDLGQLIEQLLGILRDCMAAATGAPVEAFLFTSVSGQSTIIEVASRWGLETVLAAMQILDHTLARLRYSTHGRTLAELAVVRICALENLTELASLIRELAHPGATGSGADQSGGIRPSAASALSAAPVSRPTTADGPTSASSANLVPPRAVPDWAKKKAAPDELASLNDQPKGNLPASNSPDVPPMSIGADGASSPRPLSPDEANAIWREGLQSLGSDLVADNAAMAERVVLSVSSAAGQVGTAGTIDTANFAPHRLAVHFSAKYNSCKTFCERPDQLSKLERALSEVARWPVRLELIVGRDGGETAGAEPGVGQPRASREPTPSMASSRQGLRQRIQEKSEHPLVRRAMELFGATPVHVESPRSAE